MRCTQQAVGIVAGINYRVCFEYNTFSKRAEVHVVSIQTTALCDFSFDDTERFREWYMQKLNVFEKYCLGFPYEKI